MRQEEEEEGVRWRVEAEVRLAVDRAQQAAAQQEAQMHKDMADLKVRSPLPICSQEDAPRQPCLARERLFFLVRRACAS